MTPKVYVGEEEDEISSFLYKAGLVYLTFSNDGTRVRCGFQA
jgi:hypothetical protein